jgi:hypothetical protein
MTRSQVSGGGNKLRIWRVAANILAWGLGEGQTTSHRKKLVDCLVG